MCVFGVGNWSWPEKKPLGEVTSVSLVSLVSLWEGQFQCLFTDWFVWFWGWCWRSSFSHFTSALAFVTRSPVTSYSNCLPIPKLVWWSPFSFIPRCLIFFVSASCTLEPCRRLCFLSGKIPWSTVLEDLLYPSVLMCKDVGSCRVFCRVCQIILIET